MIWDCEVDGAVWWTAICQSKPTHHQFAHPYPPSNYQKKKKKNNEEEEEEITTIEIGLAWCSSLGFVEKGGNDVE